MSQTQNSGSSTIEILESAAKTGQPSALKDVKAESVLKNEERALPELLRLCDSSEERHSLAFLNAAWKLLLTVTSLSNISSCVYSRILQFMLTQLQNQIFSHDWLDGRKIKLAAFVASHVVSAIRAHTSYAARDSEIIGMTIELYSTVCLTVTTSENTEAARQLYQSIIVRLLAILEAMGSACEGSEPLSMEEELQLILQSLSNPPREAAAVLASASVAAGSSVAALAAMLATLKPFLILLLQTPIMSQTSTKRKEMLITFIEPLFASSLLWLPDMRLVLPAGDDVSETAAAVSPCEEELGIILLRRRIVQHARDLPRDIFAGEFEINENSESSSEINLDGQLILLLRGLACGSIEAMRYKVYSDYNEKINKNFYSHGSLLRSRVFSLLLTALLVPNSSSVARVLLVWEAVLHRLSDLDRLTLGAELLQLGEEQLRGLQIVSEDKAIHLRRFLNSTATILAEICRLIGRPPEYLEWFNINKGISEFPSSQQISFCRMVETLYNQTNVYQWWNEEVTINEEVTDNIETWVMNLNNELQTVFKDWQFQNSNLENDISNKLQTLIISIPGKINNILRLSTTPSSIITIFITVTKILQTIVESEFTIETLRICARFVAAELVAVAGFIQLDDSTILACVRRLVDISFSVETSTTSTTTTTTTTTTTSSKLLSTSTTMDVTSEEGVEGMTRYHAAICLRSFAQRNTLVPLGKLRLSEISTSALMNLLQEKSAANDYVDIRVCEGLLLHQAEDWQGLISRFSQATSSETMGSLFDLAPHEISSQSDLDSKEGRFLSPLHRCEETLRSLLQWQESGRILQQSEEEVLSRLGQLIHTAINMTHSPPASSGEVMSSVKNMTTETVFGSPEVINVD